MIYFFPYIVMLIGGIGLWQGGVAVWSGFLLLFAAIPTIEFFSRNLKFNSALFKSNFADVSLFLTPVALSFLLYLALRQAQISTHYLELTGIILSTGAMLGAFGINSAHELVHRKEKYIRALGVYNLTLVNFSHWGLEHVFGHHKYVATPLDSATARQNESVYPFWIRNYFGTLKGAWHISKTRVSAYGLISVLVSIVIYVFFGLKVLLVWWGISVVAILLLQTVDYIEHYALVRPKNAEGNYMAVKATHSWDSSSLLTNIALFNLGFHSHHHMKAVVHFEDLVEQEAARKMPFGYSVMILFALLPWAYIPYMNRRVNLVANGLS